MKESNKGADLDRPLDAGIMEELAETAVKQMAFSYAPYSGFKVGAALLAGHVGSPAGGVTEGLFLSFRAFPHRLRGGSEHLAHASQNGKLVFGAGRADRVFPAVSVCAFPDGCAGRSGHRDSSGISGYGFGEGGF